jgi:hypothetical protein
LVPVNDHSNGGGSLGSVAQPAKKISATPKTNAKNLNTRQLCGTEMRTQAFTICDLRFTGDPA